MNETAPVCLLIVGISPTRIGGMEIQLKEVCRQLRDRGWQAVIALESPLAPVLSDYFKDLPNVRFTLAPHHGGLAPRQIPMYWRVVREARPQMVVYVFNGILRFLPWVAYLQRAKRIIYWDQSSKAIGYVPEAFPLMKRLLGRALTWPVDRVTAVAHYTGKCTAIQGIFPAERIATVHNAVPLSDQEFVAGAAEFRRRFNIPTDDSLLVQVSWLVPEKGIDMLLRVFRRVLDAHPRTTLAIVGDGAQRAEYEAVAQQLGVTESVRFTGSVSQPAENGVFTAGDVYCQMSQWEEACPLVVEEAQAAGRPVVATRVGGIPELILEGETGHIVGRQDEAAAADCVLGLLNDPARRQRMGQAARRHAFANFNLVSNITKLLDEWKA